MIYIPTRSIFYFKIAFIMILFIISINYVMDVKERNLIKILFKNYTYKPLKSFLLKKFDGNNEKFDDLVVKYCNVYQLNTTIECLKKLEEYDTKKVSFVFDDNKDSYIYYHTFWQPVKSKSYHERVMKLNILSYLATQNLIHTRLIIWSMTSLSAEDEIKEEFSEFVKAGVLQFRLIDLEKLCLKGVFKLRYKYCTKVKNSDVKLLSDFIRFLVLYNFGGIYFDGDTMLLRDMIPFWDKTFVYRWSYTESYNTAIMGLSIGHSQSIEDIYKLSVIPVLKANELVNIFYPTEVKNTIQFMNLSGIFNNKDLNVYSSVLFDPAWLCFDLNIVFNQNEKIIPFCPFHIFYDIKITGDKFKMETLFPGAFTYNLRLKSCGSCKISTQSYFHYVEKYFRSKVEFLKKF